MPWPEVELALKENRHELILWGSEVSQRIQEAGLDSTIFAVQSLNYLNIHKTCLASIDDDLSRLLNLQTLVLHSNKLNVVPSSLTDLEKLKVLDLSNNNLEEFSLNLEKLAQLSTVNLSNNALGLFKSTFCSSAKLHVLDLSNNKLEEFPSICHLVSLCDLKLNNNAIETIPTEVQQLVALKNLDLSENRVKNVPGELTDCSKLKQLNLQGNPIADRRLLKLIDQCRTKQIIEYVKQHCPKTVGAEQQKPGKNRKSNKSESSPSESNMKISVKRCEEQTLKVVVMEEVKKIRPHILLCIVHNLQFTAEKFRKFIQLQTRLHDAICEKRQAATLATHDLQKIVGDLIYTAKEPKSLQIQPLNRSATTMSGEQLFAQLKSEAEALRKEKKRNVYTGIHKYLYLLEGQKLYPCLTDANGQVVSFPPITNSDVTKISTETRSILVEVTSTVGLQTCKNVLDAFLKETLLLLVDDHDAGGTLEVQQTKVTDAEGNLRNVYPSKSDLHFDTAASITVIREN